MSKVFNIHLTFIRDTFFNLFKIYSEIYGLPTNDDKFIEGMNQIENFYRTKLYKLAEYNNYKENPTRNPNPDPLLLDWVIIDLINQYHYLKLLETDIELKCLMSISPMFIKNNTDHINKIYKLINKQSFNYKYITSLLAFSMSNVEYVDKNIDNDPGYVSLSQILDEFKDITIV